MKKPLSGPVYGEGDRPEARVHFNSWLSSFVQSHREFSNVHLNRIYDKVVGKEKFYYFSLFYYF